MFILSLKEIGIKDIENTGGKGASLGELVSAGFNVPSGFVIVSSVFDNFLIDNKIHKEIDNKLSNLDYSNLLAIKSVSIEIFDLIEGGKIGVNVKKEITKGYKNLDSEFVAVRSSATLEDSGKASWAGILESYLNVSEDALIKRIKDCWKSLFSDRAIQYRKQKELTNEKIGMAVVVQEIINSDASGVTFTANPANNDKNQMVIEAGLGLGEAIVLGQVTPDTYILNNQQMLIADKNISSQEKGLKCDFIDGGIKWEKLDKEGGAKQKLSDEQILELADVCNKVFEHYRKPQDIEWCFYKNELYILQSRPITTL